MAALSVAVVMTAPAMLLSTISTWHRGAEPDRFMPLSRALGLMAW